MGLNVSLRSEAQDILMVKQTKVSLNTFDDVGCFINDYEKMPWGHVNNSTS